MEVTGRKDVQNGGRLILKMITGFGLFSTLSKVKIYFFLLFTSNLSYFNSFKLPYKIRLQGFRSPLNKSLHLFKSIASFWPFLNLILTFLQAAKVTKSGHHLFHDRTSKGYGSIPGLMLQTYLHACLQRVNTMQISL